MDAIKPIQPVQPVRPTMPVAKPVTPTPGNPNAAAKPGEEQSPLAQPKPGEKLFSVATDKDPTGQFKVYAKDPAQAQQVFKKAGGQGAVSQATLAEQDISAIVEILGENGIEEGVDYYVADTIRTNDSKLAEDIADIINQGEWDGRRASAKPHDNEYYIELGKEIEQGQGLSADKIKKTLKICHKILRSGDATDEQKDQLRDIITRTKHQLEIILRKQSNNSSNVHIAETKVSEIGFATNLGKLNISDTDAIKKSKVDGQIGQRDVMLLQKGESNLYFFADENKIDALILLDGNRLAAIKNFTNLKGLVHALFNYIVNIKKMKLIIQPHDSLTPFGIDWLVDQIKRPNGFKITDDKGNAIDTVKLKQEWEKSKKNYGSQTGETGIVVSESPLGIKLRENELSIMPYDIFGVHKIKNMKETKMNNKKITTLEGIPDVDHMRGSVIRNADMITDTVEYITFKDWERAANSVNNRVYDDNAEYVSDTGRKTVEADNVVFAMWDRSKKKGWVNIKGKSIKPMPDRKVAEDKHIPTDDEVGFSVDSERAYQAVIDRFGNHINHDEESGIMYIPARMWPNVEQVAFDADGVGAEQTDGYENPEHYGIEEASVELKTFRTKKGDLVRKGNIDYLFADESGSWHTRRNDYKAGRDIAPKWQSVSRREVPGDVKDAINGMEQIAEVSAHDYDSDWDYYDARDAEGSGDEEADADARAFKQGKEWLRKRAAEKSKGVVEGVKDTIKNIGKKLVKPLEDPILNQMKDITNAANKREIDAQNKKYAPSKMNNAQGAVEESTHGLNKRVRIVGGPADAKGKIGTVGEVRPGQFKGAEKTYTVDYEDDAGSTRSIQLKAKDLRLVKESSTEFTMDKKTLSEKAKNPYAVGIAAAKKSAGISADTAKDLPKSVVKKGHEIAKAVAGKKVAEATKEITGGRVHTAEPGGYGRQSDDEEMTAKDRARIAAKKKAVKATQEPRGRGRPKKDTTVSTSAGQAGKELQSWIVGSVPKASKSLEKLPKIKHKIGKKGDDDEEMDEGNEFTGALAAAKASGKKEFTVGGKKHSVKENMARVQVLKKQIKETMARVQRLPMDQQNDPRVAAMVSTLEETVSTVVKRVLKESTETLAHICKRFPAEVKSFSRGEELDSDLYDTLYDYYAHEGEMPYGVMKARTGDPYEWVASRFSKDIGNTYQEESTMHEDADELPTAEEMNSDFEHNPMGAIDEDEVSGANMFMSGDTVFHSNRMGKVDRQEGDKVFVHTGPGKMDVWPASEVSLNRQGAVPTMRKTIDDIGRGIKGFMTGKAEESLRESVNKSKVSNTANTDIARLVNLSGMKK